MQLTIILDRLRSAHNTGNIFRLAEAVGADIIACGYTPCPPHPKLAKTAMGCDELVKCRHCEDAASAIRMLKAEEENIEVLALDVLPGAVEVWKRSYSGRIAIVAGNEALGISGEALALCDGAIKLPMFGQKASVNVGNAVAAALFAIEANYRES